ncbi:MAG: Smg protein [Glaciecola sp.]|jgi:Smg protein
MFDILMYLFENVVHNESELRVDHDELTDELIRAGFHHDEIFKALAWVEKLAALQETDATPYLSRVTVLNSTRVYTIEEQVRLDVQCRGFLIFLEQVKVLDVSTREMVIDRTMEIESAEFCLEDLKWVILMVLFNVPGKEWAYEQMEDLLFEVQEGPLH